MRTHSTEPTIYPKNPTRSDMNKSWRVRFDFYINGERHMITRRFSINDTDDFNERLTRARAGVLKIQTALRKGWNPVTDTYPDKSPKDVERERLQQMTLPEAMDYAYKKKLVNWEKKTGQDYASVVKYLKVGAVTAALDQKKIKEFTRADFREVLDEAMGKKFSPCKFNRYREYLSSLVSEMIEHNILEANPVAEIKTFKIKKGVAHRPPTEKERELIISHIKVKHPNYYRFLAVLYGCTIRPKEITRIKVKYLREGFFRLPKEITKNGVERDVIIPNWVMSLLKELDLSNPEYYIFSSFNKYKSFLPGPNRMHSNTTTTTWRKLVKEGLKLDVNQYSLKKLSGDDMVKLQVSKGLDRLLELPKSQMGHGDIKQTEVYVKEHKTVCDNLIRDSMPVL